MSNFSVDETFDLSEIAAMPRGMTLEEAQHYLMTDELPDDDPFKDLEFSTSEESRRAQRDEERAQEEFDDGGLSPDEVIAFLTGERAITAAITAAATVHTGAMIALVPTVDDASRLAVPGGLPADELHCTIKYLGEAADISDETQDQILRRMEAAASALDVIDAEGFALAIFNPPGYSQDRDPCTVLMVSGDELSESYEFICSMVHGAIDDKYSIMPWIPHVTLSETGDADLTPLVDQVGPITFDRIRVAFAGENYDFYLGSGQTGTIEPELETSEPPQAPEQTSAVGSYTVQFESVFDLQHPDVQMWLDEYSTWAKERGVKSPGSVGHQLRDYWVSGPGAAKIRWNTEGDGTRCIKQLRKYVGVRAGGLCQYYHQLATGTTMGRHPGRPTEAAVGDVVSFDFDPDQDRWPAGAPDGLGGQWRDKSIGNLELGGWRRDGNIANDIWNVRRHPAGTIIARGKGTYDNEYVMRADGSGGVNIYDDLGGQEEPVVSFDEKGDLYEWLQTHEDEGGGSSAQWKVARPPKPADTPTPVVAPTPVQSHTSYNSDSVVALKKITSGTPVAEDNLSTGQVGEVYKVKTDAGTYISKSSGSWGHRDGETITDAEELVAELGELIGARVPAVERVNKTTVNMNYVPGLPAGEHRELGKDNDVDALAASPQSRMLGMLDLITFNGDRHDYNWIIDESGPESEAVGIDHGLAWMQVDTDLPDFAALEAMWEESGSPFAPDLEFLPDTYTQEDIDRVRTALTSMESRFKSMGREQWYKSSHSALDFMEIVIQEQFADED